MKDNLKEINNKNLFNIKITNGIPIKSIVCENINQDIYDTVFIKIMKGMPIKDKVWQNIHQNIFNTVLEDIFNCVGDTMIKFKVNFYKYNLTNKIKNNFIKEII